MTIPIYAKTLFYLSYQFLLKDAIVYNPFFDRAAVFLLILILFGKTPIRCPLAGGVVIRLTIHGYQY